MRCGPPVSAAARSTTSPSNSDSGKERPMRRVIVAAVSTISGLIMLLSFKPHALPTTHAAPPAAVSGAGPSTTTTTNGSSTSVGSANSPSTTSTTAGATTVTVTGNAASTRYGPVQVQVTVTNGKITAVDA